MSGRVKNEGIDAVGENTTTSKACVILAVREQYSHTSVGFQRPKR